MINPNMEIKQLKKLNEKVFFSKEKKLSIFHIKANKNQIIFAFILIGLDGNASIISFC